jgi:hypothetical protein
LGSADGSVIPEFAKRCGSTSEARARNEVGQRGQVEEAGKTFKPLFRMLPVGKPSIMIYVCGGRREADPKKVAPTDGDDG